MNIKNAILIGLAALAGMFFLYTLSVPKGTPTEYGGTNTEQQAPKFQQQTNSEGAVEVVVQPVDLGSSTWTFNFGIDTHTGSLDMDILKAVTLTDDRGDSIAPIAWAGPGPGGHHRNGTLTFPAPSSTPKSITVTVVNVGGIATRTFSWNLP